MTKEEVYKAVDLVLGNKDGILDKKDIIYVGFNILTLLFKSR